MERAHAAPKLPAVAWLIACGTLACARSGRRADGAPEAAAAPAPPAADATAGVAATAPSPLQVAVDARVELVSIVFRLAGNPEYGRASGGPYVAAVDRRFAAFARHPAVAAAAELRAKQGISYDAPVELALYLDDSFRPIRALAPPPPGLDPRWGGAPVDAFVDLLGAFASEAGFREFLQGQSAHVGAVEERFRSFLRDKAVVDWFDEVFGRRAGASFRVIPGLLTGPMSYGARAVSPDGSEVVAQVLGLENPDAQGLPRPGDATLELLVHELAHSYVNPLFEPRAADLEAVAAPLFRRVEAAMRRQSYPDWGIVLNESVVRAVTILFLRDRAAPGRARGSLREQERLSFLWTGDLVEALDRLRRENAGTLPAGRMVDVVRDALTAWRETRAPS